VGPRTGLDEMVKRKIPRPRRDSTVDHPAHNSPVSLSYPSSLPNVGKKVKLSLCLTMHHAMTTYWGVEVELHASFVLGTKRR
jgi:hypothetical protein